MTQYVEPPEEGTEFVGIKPNETRKVLRVYSMRSVGAEIHYGVVADDRQHYTIAHRYDGRWVCVVAGMLVGLNKKEPLHKDDDDAKDK